MLEIIIVISICIILFAFFLKPKKQKEIDRKGEIIKKIRRLIQEDYLQDDILAALKNEGLSDENALSLYREAEDKEERSFSKRRLQYALVGLLFVIGGIALSISSYMNPGYDGQYSIYWGVIATGVLLIIYGITRY